jgi:hypothetical protein
MSESEALASEGVWLLLGAPVLAYALVSMGLEEWRTAAAAARPLSLQEAPAHRGVMAELTGYLDPGAAGSRRKAVAMFAGEGAIALVTLSWLVVVLKPGEPRQRRPRRPLPGPPGRRDPPAEPAGPTPT